MKIRHAYLLLLFTITLLGSNACKDNNYIEPVPVDPRQKMIDDYKTNYLGSAAANTGWTGNTASCVAGTVPNDVNQKVLQRINYFRRQVGLNDNITLDTAKNRKCQEAALMMHANGALNHTPPTTWKCYTADGAAAAGSSNLHSIGGVNAITGYIQDPGSSNTACGHRRWILYSRSLIMGHGSTTNNNALWVIGGGSPTPPKNMPAFISWPPQNHVAAALIFPRWSFSIPGADFTNAIVTMTDSKGVTVSLNVVSVNVNGYGDNTIVWEPTGIVTNSATDVTYNVKVNDVQLSGGETKSFSYKVVIVKI
jgi:uncharacterized protein YkwD